MPFKNWNQSHNYASNGLRNISVLETPMETNQRAEIGKEEKVIGFLEKET